MAILRHPALVVLVLLACIKMAAAHEFLIVIHSVGLAYNASILSDAAEYTADLNQPAQLLLDPFFRLDASDPNAPPLWSSAINPQQAPAPSRLALPALDLVWRTNDDNLTFSVWDDDQGDANHHAFDRSFMASDHLFSTHLRLSPLNPALQVQLNASTKALTLSLNYSAWPCACQSSGGSCIRGNDDPANVACQCPHGHYSHSDLHGRPTCQPWAQCLAGQVEVQAPSPFIDRQCAACGPGQACPTPLPATTRDCLAQDRLYATGNATICAIDPRSGGHYLQTDAHGRGVVRLPCPTKSFCPPGALCLDACISCQECGDSFSQASACSATSNAVCEPETTFCNNLDCGDEECLGAIIFVREARCECPDGQTWNSTYRRCISDATPCNFGITVCGQASCQAQGASFSCHCPKGLTFDGQGACIDQEDTCTPASCTVSEDTACVDLAEAPMCRCDALSHGTSCEHDLQPCQLDGKPTCSHNASCSYSGVFNEEASALSVQDLMCACEESGFAGSHCTLDVDECALQPCGLHGTCINLPGGFTCNCDPGYDQPWENAPCSDVSSPNITLDNAFFSIDIADGLSVSSVLRLTRPHVSDNSGVVPALEVVVPLNMTANSNVTVTLRAVDETGNSATQLVIVRVLDLSAPLLTLRAEPANQHPVQTAFVAPTAMAQDAVDGPCPVTLVNSVDSNRLGCYDLIWSAQDQAGNRVKLSRQVCVVDRIPPTLDIQVSSVPHRVPVGSTFAPPSVVVQDNYDASASLEQWRVPNTIDTRAEPGSEALLTYFARDASNNTGNATLRLLFVDIEGPVITYNEQPVSRATQTVAFGTPLRGLPIGINDNADLNPRWSASGYSRCTAGLQTLRINASDASDNVVLAYVDLDVTSPSSSYMTQDLVQASWKDENVDKTRVPLLLQTVVPDLCVQLVSSGTDHVVAAFYDTHRQDWLEASIAIDRVANGTHNISTAGTNADGSGVVSVEQMSTPTSIQLGGITLELVAYAGLSNGNGDNETTSPTSSAGSIALVAGVGAGAVLLLALTITAVVFWRRVHQRRKRDAVRTRSMAEADMSKFEFHNMRHMADLPGGRIPASFHSVDSNVTSLPHDDRVYATISVTERSAQTLAQHAENYYSEIGDNTLDSSQYCVPVPLPDGHLYASHLTINAKAMDVNLKRSGSEMQVPTYISRPRDIGAPVPVPIYDELGQVLSYQLRAGSEHGGMHIYVAPVRDPATSPRVPFYDELGNVVGETTLPPLNQVEVSSQQPVRGFVQTPSTAADGFQSLTFTSFASSTGIISMPPSIARRAAALNPSNDAGTSPRLAWQESIQSGSYGFELSRRSSRLSAQHHAVTQRGVPGNADLEEDASQASLSAAAVDLMEATARPSSNNEPKDRDDGEYLRVDGIVGTEEPSDALDRNMLAALEPRSGMPSPPPPSAASAPSTDATLSKIFTVHTMSGVDAEVKLADAAPGTYLLRLVVGGITSQSCDLCVRGADTFTHHALYFTKEQAMYFLDGTVGSTSVTSLDEAMLDILKANPSTFIQQWQRGDPALSLMQAPHED
ncbi:uncharacterized protein MONBRDRAFT_29555 [Monosiga brevicollis MX1]|uniref:EGF-like domain-containing protein n=1 Tax=Monosiga brevicollis TaxID=81824 RepID=A9VBF6_MONBE|nr:uncharacterized protein MONBRDRAFT_29555 [Monosiga brevicollis MX1]EDQ85178.1 predicted protein [Monosiga brevicollis MX1]|eukprot:XP_001750003.1 hypothetical protein [Monosiga brevicollis MX1]